MKTLAQFVYVTVVGSLSCAAVIGGIAIACMLLVNLLQG